MNVIARERGTGKTKELIQESLETGVPIYCWSKEEEDRIVQKSFAYFGRACNTLTKGTLTDEPGKVLIDNAEKALEIFFASRYNLDVVGCTISTD